ncbi:MAG: DUF3347 domain-containing protein [Ginsengibacter sp.]
MKKIFFIVAICATAFVQQSFAQPVPVQREDTSTQSTFSPLLDSYYDIKDALVAGKANTASIQASEFVKAAKSVDSKDFSADTRDALVKDAGAIAATKNITQQREHFASFSTNMAALAKVIKLSAEPIYEAYCPMKKSYWLSSDKAIKNPYYGNAMLTCGKVTETIQ